MVRDELEPSIVAKLSPLFADRFYPEVKPQEPPAPQYPFGVYTVISEQRFKSANCDAIDQTSVQIDIYCLTANLRRDKVKQVKAAILELGGRFEALRQQTFDKDLRVFRASLDCNFLFN